MRFCYDVGTEGCEMQDKTVIEVQYRLCPMCNNAAPMQRKAAIAWRKSAWGDQMAPNIRIFWEVLPHSQKGEEGLGCYGTGLRLHS